MAPRSAAAIAAAGVHLRLLVELVVPDQIVEFSVEYLFERGADRVGGAGAAGAFLERSLLAACDHKVLAVLVARRLAAERAGAVVIVFVLGSAGREVLGVELVDKPPVDGFSFFDQRRRRVRRPGDAVIDQKRAAA